MTLEGAFSNCRRADSRLSSANAAAVTCFSLTSLCSFAASLIRRARPKSRPSVSICRRAASRALSIFSYFWASTG